MILGICFILLFFFYLLLLPDTHSTFEYLYSVSLSTMLILSEVNIRVYWIYPYCKLFNSDFSVTSANCLYCSYAFFSSYLTSIFFYFCCLLHPLQPLPLEGSSLFHPCVAFALLRSFSYPQLPFLHPSF